jgi:hypothetical protein
LTWRDVNDPEQPAATDVAACCVPTPAAPASPIDEFIRHVAHVITLGSTNALDDSQTLGRLLVLGLVTGCETYFRRSIVGILNLCPVAKESASSHLVPLGAVDYYAADEVPLALFDGKSLTGYREIQKATRDFTGIELPNRGSLTILGEQYSRIGHLRHAAVHAHGNLTLGNVRAIGVSAAGRSHEVQVTHVQLQAIAADCLSFVRAYNRTMFEELVQRWISRGVIRSRWSDDWRLVRRAHALFYSTEDGAQASDARAAYASFPLRPAASLGPTP